MPGGVVEGEMTTTSAEIAGTVRGRLTVRERLVLKASAVIEGDILTDKLVVEDGATFNGECRMGQTADAPSRTDRRAARAQEPDASFTVVSGDAALAWPSATPGPTGPTASTAPTASGPRNGPRPRTTSRAKTATASRPRAPATPPTKSTPGVIQDAYGDGMRAAGEHIGLGVQIAASMLLFVGLGIAADRWLGTEPWGVIAGAALGMVGIVALGGARRQREQEAVAALEGRGPGPSSRTKNDASRSVGAYRNTPVRVGLEVAVRPRGRSTRLLIPDSYSLVPSNPRPRGRRPVLPVPVPHSHLPAVTACLHLHPAFGEPQQAPG